MNGDMERADEDGDIADGDIADGERGARDHGTGVGKD
jgi:hypothetical protein